MAWTIEISETAKKQLNKLDHIIIRRIRKFLAERIAMLDDPRVIGEALQGPRFGEFWKYRVGDYRLICQIQDEKVIVTVLRVGHRKEIYKQ